jgi:hypothetical protein
MLRIVPNTLPPKYEHFSDGFELHLPQLNQSHIARGGSVLITKSSNLIVLLRVEVLRKEKVLPLIGAQIFG